MNGKEKTGGELFIVDNSDEDVEGPEIPSGLDGNHDAFDIASGYF